MSKVLKISDAALQHMIPVTIDISIPTCVFALLCFRFLRGARLVSNSWSKPVPGTAKHGSQETRDKLNKREQGRSTKLRKILKLENPL